MFYIQNIKHAEQQSQLIIKKGNENICLISFGQIIFLFLLTSFVYKVQSTCSISNSLTYQQNVKFKNFNSAKYLTPKQENQVKNIYSSLNRKLDNYLIELQDQYTLQINDIQQCINIPQYISFNSNDDVWICLNGQIMILNCNKQWELKIGCGTFIQLHRPFDTQVLGQIYLEESLIANYFNIPLTNICAGTYHLWFIYSTRIGKVIKNIKTIFVSYPNCQCT